MFSVTRRSHVATVAPDAVRSQSYNFLTPVNIIKEHKHQKRAGKTCVTYADTQSLRLQVSDCGWYLCVVRLLISAEETASRCNSFLLAPPSPDARSASRSASNWAHLNNHLTPIFLKANRFPPFINKCFSSLIRLGSAGGAGVDIALIFQHKVVVSLCWFRRDMFFSVFVHNFSLKTVDRRGKKDIIGGKWFQVMHTAYLLNHVCLWPKPQQAPAIVYISSAPLPLLPSCTFLN